MRYGSDDAHSLSQDLRWDARQTSLPPRPALPSGGEYKHRARSTLIQNEQEELVPEYCSYFEGKTFDELDQLARSFHFGMLGIFHWKVRASCELTSRKLCPPRPAVRSATWHIA